MINFELNYIQLRVISCPSLNVGTLHIIQPNATYLQL